MVAKKPVIVTPQLHAKPEQKGQLTTLQKRVRELEQANRHLENRESERHRALEEAQALTHLGSWEWDVASSRIFWSDELYRMYGLKPQEREVGFDEFIDMIHPDDQERVRSVIYLANQTGEPFEFEHRIILHNGRQRVLYGMGKVITDKAGQPVRMLGTSQDITSQKNAERDLQKSDERFRAVTNATHDLVYDLDLQRHFMWFNDVLQTEYGYPVKPTDRSLEWWQSRIHPEDALRIEEELAALLLSDQRTWHAEYRFRKADGSYAIIRNRAYMLVGSDGTPERIIGSCLDITQQRHLDRAKDEFISLVSHQLRTPLTIIRLYGNMLSDGIAGPLEELQFAYVSKITGASVRLIKLVGDILNISRLELNRIKIDCTPSDANELIRSSIEEVGPLIKEKGITVSFKPQDDIGLIPIDTTFFGEIVNNLLGNAIRYSRNQHSEVSISLKKGKRGYLLTVRDNGLGIPSIDQPHIFERFYRARNAASVDSDGSGLGLYMVKMFVETSGGKIWFKSTEGTGTTFYVLFPPDGMTATPVKPTSQSER
jgi:PAS domain S-box-containing protein